MPKEKSLAQLEAQMAKLKEKKTALHDELKVLADERRRMIFAQQPEITGGIVLTPDPAILEAKSEQ